MTGLKYRPRPAQASAQQPCHPGSFVAGRAVVAEVGTYGLARRPETCRRCSWLSYYMEDFGGASVGKFFLTMAWSVSDCASPPRYRQPAGVGGT